MELFHLCGKDVSDELLKDLYALELQCSYEPYEEDIFREIVCYDTNDTFFIKEDDEIVGVATFNSLTKKYDNSIYLGNLTISPNSQRKGYASKLMAYACQFYESNERSLISTEVDNINTSAMKFYEKLGFAPVPELSDEEYTFLIADKNKIANICL